MSWYQKRYLHFISENPGCIIADVDRACRVNPQAGHKWVYDGVNRLIRRGIVRSQKSDKGNGVQLFVKEN